MEKFLSEFSYELIYTPKNIDIKAYPEIRDKYDLPILVSAMISDVDILVTGDKDFADLKIEKPEIVTPSELKSKYFY